LALAGASLLGAAAGLLLLVRRSRSLALRRISVPDDFASNALATLFAAFAFASVAAPSTRPPFLFAAMILLLYVPVGKIRHCVFFVPTRIRAGAFFGRRGTYPPAHEARRARG
jgi:hypothetical protein